MMKVWNFYIDESYKENEKIFFNILNDFNSVGEIIFKERNTLRKIEDKTLGTLAVKSFKQPHLINQYIYTNLRKSKAYRSFHNASLLISKDIFTPTPLAFFEEKKKGKLIRSFYFSKYYDYDFTFRELIEQKETFPDWSNILINFTNFIFKVHNADILFKDLSPGNVLIKKSNQSYEFGLIDLNRMTFKNLSLTERLKNFIRLSLTDDMIPIIGEEYALLSQQDKNKIISFLFNENSDYINRKERKKNIKKIIGIK